ncbi:MAG: hypothetical protein CMH57_01910 [Myxococcales bacterium]|nr:hypothetical protein [Myxococcales bacterium]
MTHPRVGLTPRHVTGALLIAALLAISAPAAASYGPSVISSPRKGLYAPVGVNLGYSGVGRYGGLLLGAEGSLVWYDSSWFGLYGDLLRDFGAGSFRASVGPEVGNQFVGVDGGVVFDTGGDARARVGGRFRGLLTAGSVTFYGGATFFEEESAAEIGLLLKFPMFVEGKPRDWE